MVGTDINKESIKNANKNIETNNLQHLIQGNYLIKMYNKLFVIIKLIDYN